MGGCCCCSSKGTALSTGPTYYYGQRASEEQIPLSSQHEAVSTRVAGLLVDTNLDTSTPDTYRPPPPPLPYDVASGHPQTPPAIQEIHVNKVDAAARTNFDTVQDADNGNSREVSNFEDRKEVDCKANLNLGVDSAKETEIELSKKVEPVDLAVVEEEEDVCPICLEEYDAENPKIITKCDHHYHLACILEWMERSDTCPVCDQEIIFSPPIN